MDVLEHIPEEKVVPCLEQIAARVAKGAYFNIALAEDNLGQLIGEKTSFDCKTERMVARADFKIFLNLKLFIG